MEKLRQQNDETMKMVLNWNNPLSQQKERFSQFALSEMRFKLIREKKLSEKAAKKLEEEHKEEVD